MTPMEETFTQAVKEHSKKSNSAKYAEIYKNARPKTLHKGRTCQCRLPDGTLCGKPLPKGRYFNCIACAKRMANTYDCDTLSMGF